jgi:sec-independent protein translocase protein TatA
MFSGISPWQLLIVLAIVVVLFGTKKLRGLGGDLGGAIKGFKKAVSEEEKPADDKQVEDQAADAAPNNLESESTEKQTSDNK